MRKLLVFTLLLGMFTHAYAEGLSEADSRKLCNKAMSLFSQNEIKEGYELLSPYWPLPKSEITALVYQTESQWSSVQSRFGKNAGYEFLETQRIGNSFVKYIYLQKFANHALRWQFTFYKPGNSWHINSIKFDDSIDELFK